MENASKALIIAGAILLSILLISLGIMIFNQAQSAVDGSGMSDAEVQTFNSRFLKYEGRQKGSVVRALVQEVMSNNNSAEASDETRVSINMPNDKMASGFFKEIGDQSIVKLSSQPNSNPTITDKLKNTVTYTVSFKYYNGRIGLINISF